MIRALVVLTFLTVCAAAASATTWYVRLDGGSRSQCTGTANRPYSGPSRGKQPCAFAQVRYLYTDGSYDNRHWIISGGDTVIIAKGSYRIGYLGPNAKQSDGSCPGDPYSCGMPPLPSGTPAKHTRILGEEYQSCRKKSQIYGGYATGAVVSLSGSRFVDLQCLEITDHSDCSRVGEVSSEERCRSDFPLSDYASSGIVTDSGTSDIFLADLDIHGLANQGIVGSVGGKINVLGVRIAFNGSAGWDFDDGRGSQPSAAVNASFLVVEGNGCNEEYPVRHSFPARNCFDQDHGGYGDGLGTPDMRLNFKCDHCIFRYNTQDGLDLLHAYGGSVEITNSTSVGNMGQQWKVGSVQSLLFSNNLTENNCNRMSVSIEDAPSGYNKSLSLFCRAAGDGVTVSLGRNGQYSFLFNTYIGYGDTSFDFGCSASGCSGARIDFVNNIVVGYRNPRSRLFPGVFYFDNVNESNIWRNRSHNIFFNARNCPASFPAEQCSDPKFVNLPQWAGETTFQQINPRLSPSSPARNSGSSVSGIDRDQDGALRPVRPSIGAFEYR